jgi:hypothetical protein
VPIYKWLFCPIPVSGSNFNPRNIPYIPAVKIIPFLGLEQNISFPDGRFYISVCCPVLTFNSQIIIGIGNQTG